MFGNMICIARFWIRSNSSDKYVGNPLWKTGHAGVFGYRTNTSLVETVKVPFRQLWHVLVASGNITG